MQTIRKNSGDWSSQNIADFWDWQSHNDSRLQGYFTAMVGRGILNFMKKHELVKGKMLDYGCGSGHLLSIFSEEPGVELYGLDFSPDSIEETKRRIKDPSIIRSLHVIDSLPTPFEDGMFDTITFIETIEHLSDQMLKDTLTEIFRLLKPGGQLLLTTPFNEELEKHLTFCPFCRAEYHHMQHMQSFNIESLSRVLTEQGFTIAFCKNINLDKFQAGSLKFSFRTKVRNFAMAAGIKHKIQIDSTPHLVAIARK